MGRILPFGKPWLKETDWVALVEFLPRYDEQERESRAEAIGYMLAYAQRTDTRMLALVGDPEGDAYELLFSFNSAGNKKEFLRLLQANEATACEEEEIMPPHPNEILAAQPITKVLPIDVLRRVLLVATLHRQGAPPTIQ